MTQDQRKVIKHWRDSAKRDIDTARDLVKLKHYHWALFLYHLAIEKLLKALVIQAGVTPPYTHKLERLADLANLELTKVYRECLREITTFNIDARYDSEKLEFYQRTTPSYTKKWAARCEEIYQWLQKKLN